MTMLKVPRSERQYRSAEMRADEQTGSYIVTGHAATFDRYLYCYDWDGNAIYEQFLPEAFEDVDMSDVIVQYDHQGPVYARLSNGSLALNLDDVGLACRIDLSLTSKARSLYEDIASGNVCRMSWGFEATHPPEMKGDTIIWRKGDIRKIFDVSAVSLPANSGTDISARGAFTPDGVIRQLLEERQQRMHRLEAAKRKARTALKIADAMQTVNEIERRFK